LSLRVRGREAPGTAEVVTDDRAAAAQGLGELLRRVPRDTRFYKVRLDANGVLEEDAVQRAAQRNVMIRTTLSD
jgi:hypothetical protein